MIESNAAYTTYRDKQYFGSLDGLRAFCILLVLWHHSPVPLPDLDTYPQIFRRGFTGVDFFFVLSGYLITTLLLREEDRNGRFSIAGFYRRRVLRIVPVYFLVVTLCAIWWIGVRGQTQWWAYLPYYYAFLSNFLLDDIPLLAPTWSLAVEEQYYMLWPALMLLLPVLRWRVAFIVTMILAAVVVGEGLVPQPVVAPENAMARFGLPMGAYAAILLGSLTGIVLHNPKGFAVLFSVLGRWYMPLVLFVALLLAWELLPSNLQGLPNLVMHGLMAALLASLVVREDNVLAPVLKWRPFVQIGMISYGIYLWHLIGRHIGVEAADVLGFDGLSADWVAMPIYLIMSYLIALASFHWFESFFLKLKSGKPQKQPA